MVRNNVSDLFPHSGAALQIVKPMKDASVAETQAAMFECEVSHFNVPSTWLKDGVEIEMSEKFRIVVQGKLHQLKIMNTSKDDSAEYTFICGNDRVSATLTVSRKFCSLLRGNKEKHRQTSRPYQTNKKRDERGYECKCF